MKSEAHGRYGVESKTDRLTPLGRFVRSQFARSHCLYVCVFQAFAIFKSFGQTQQSNELAPVNVEARPYGEQLIGPYGAVCSSIAGIEEVRAIRDPDQVTPGPA
jgi:hypothetical protein